MLVGSPSKRNLDYAFPVFAPGLPSVYERAGFEVNRSRTSSQSSLKSVRSSDKTKSPMLKMDGSATSLPLPKLLSHNIPYKSPDHSASLPQFLQTTMGDSKNENRKDQVCAILPDPEVCRETSTDVTSVRGINEKPWSQRINSQDSSEKENEAFNIRKPTIHSTNSVEVAMDVNETKVTQLKENKDAEYQPSPHVQGLSIRETEREALSAKFPVVPKVNNQSNWDSEESQYSLYNQEPANVEISEITDNDIEPLHNRYNSEEFDFIEQKNPSSYPRSEQTAMADHCVEEHRDNVVPLDLKLSAQQSIDGSRSVSINNDHKSLTGTQVIKDVSDNVDDLGANNLSDERQSPHSSPNPKESIKRIPSYLVPSQISNSSHCDHQCKSKEPLVDQTEHTTHIVSPRHVAHEVKTFNETSGDAIVNIQLKQQDQHPTHEFDENYPQRMHPFQRVSNQIGQQSGYFPQAFNVKPLAHQRGSPPQFPEQYSKRYPQQYPHNKMSFEGSMIGPQPMVQNMPRTGPDEKLLDSNPDVFMASTPRFRQIVSRSPQSEGTAFFSSPPPNSCNQIMPLRGISNNNKTKHQIAAAHQIGDDYQMGGLDLPFSAHQKIFHMKPGHKPGIQGMPIVQPNTYPGTNQQFMPNGGPRMMPMMQYPANYQYNIPVSKQRGPKTSYQIVPYELASASKESEMSNLPASCNASKQEIIDHEYQGPSHCSFKSPIPTGVDTPVDNTLPINGYSEMPGESRSLALPKRRFSTSSSIYSSRISRMPASDHHFIGDKSSNNLAGAAIEKNVNSTNQMEEDHRGSGYHKDCTTHYSEHSQSSSISFDFNQKLSTSPVHRQSIQNGLHTYPENSESYPIESVPQEPILTNTPGHVALKYDGTSLTTSSSSESIPVPDCPLVTKSESKVSKLCRGCNQTIRGKSVRDQDGNLSGHWHPQCLKCKRCGISLCNGDIYAHKDDPHCGRCYHTASSTCCRNCGEGIEGRCLETRWGSNDIEPYLYHIQCLKCACCSMRLQHSYFDVEGKTFCAEHAFSMLPDDNTVHKRYTQYMMI